MNVLHPSYARPPRWLPPGSAGEENRAEEKGGTGGGQATEGMGG